MAIHLFLSRSLQSARQFYKIFVNQKISEAYTYKIYVFLR